jgi:monofunctional biosynthetic peptidoglycan transglycosylase
MRRWILRLTLGPLLLIIAHLLIFRQVPVPLTPLMMIRLFQGEGLEHEWVPLEEMSPHLARSVIGSEDNRFCTHSGVDWSAVWDVLEEVSSGDRARGASTISMQTVKNLYLWPSRSVIRKGLEVGLVQLLEATWSKERIIEVYLNIVELGPGIYGVEAAAQHHWGVTAASLGPDRAAAIASILPAPRARSPRSSETKRAIDRIQRRVRELGEYLDCVPKAPAVPPQAQPSAGSDSAPVPLELKDAEGEDDAAPQEPRRSKRKKVRSKRRRRSR